MKVERWKTVEIQEALNTDCGEEFVCLSTDHRNANTTGQRNFQNVFLTKVTTLSLSVILLNKLLTIMIMQRRSI